MTNTATIKLTSDQAEALAKIKSFIVNSDNKFFRLTGYAGTGKSFTICQLIKWLKSARYEVIAASPTNKAANNLRNMASEAGLDLEVITVAKLLGQQVVIDVKTGKEKFVSSDDIDISNYEVIIIDEFSMVNRDNFVDIKVEVENTYNTKVIFVGDAAQLPPVGEDEPIVATHECITDWYDLTTVVRYDGELARVAEYIRSRPMYNKLVYPFVTSDDHSIVCHERYSWLQQAVELFKSDEFKVNPNYVRFLVWRNKQADVLNAYVRQYLWGENVAKYVPGDRLIAKTPAFRLAVDARTLKDAWQIVINSSDECEVTRKGILREKDEYGHDWQHWLVPVVTDWGGELNLRILTESGLHAQKKVLVALKAEARDTTDTRKRKRLWAKYYSCLKSFDNMPYAYAITTHKAQGSSIDYIFPDTTDMKGCPDLQKILYTALTRAKVQTFIPI